MIEAKEVKLDEQQLADSFYDQILGGKIAGITVLHEDQSCLAFIEPHNPVAKAHFIVLAKNNA